MKASLGTQQWLKTVLLYFVQDLLCDSRKSAFQMFSLPPGWKWKPPASWKWKPPAISCLPLSFYLCLVLDRITALAPVLAFRIPLTARLTKVQSSQVSPLRGPLHPKCWSLGLKPSVPEKTLGPRCKVEVIHMVRPIMNQERRPQNGHVSLEAVLWLVSCKHCSFSAWTNVISHLLCLLLPISLTREWIPGFWN